MKAVRGLVSELDRIPSQPTAAWLLGTALVLALADVGSQLSGNSVVPGGPVDETAHVLTTLLVLWALGPRVARRFMPSALVASFVIDVDHVPSRLGTDFLTAGTPRPYTHSLVTIVVVLALVALVRRPLRRDLLLGVAIGLAVHFWRDMSEWGTGVSLLWPWSKSSFGLPHWSYAVILAGLLLILARRVMGLPAVPSGHMSSEGSGS